MKKRFLSTLYILLAVSIAIFSTTAATNSKTTKTTQTKTSTSKTIQYKKYTDPDSGLTINLPTNWKLNKDNKPKEVTFSDGSETNYILIAQESFDTDEKLVESFLDSDSTFLTEMLKLMPVVVEQSFEEMDETNNTVSESKSSIAKKVVIDGVNFNQIVQVVKITNKKNSKESMTITLNHHLGYSNGTLFSITGAKLGKDTSSIDKAIKSIKFPK